MRFEAVAESKYVQRRAGVVCREVFGGDDGLPGWREGVSLGCDEVGGNVPCTLVSRSGRSLAGVHEHQADGLLARKWLLPEVPYTAGGGLANIGVLGWRAHQHITLRWLAFPCRGLR